MTKLKQELKNQFDLDFTTSKSVKIADNKILLELTGKQYLVLESSEAKIKSYNKVVSYLSEKGYVKQQILKTKQGDEYIKYQNEYITVYELPVAEIPRVNSLSILDFEKVLNLVNSIHKNSKALANLVFDNSEYSIDTTFIEFMRRVEATNFVIHSDRITKKLNNRYKFDLSNHVFELIKAHSRNIEVLSEESEKVLNTFIDHSNILKVGEDFAVVISDDCTVGSPIFDYAKMTIEAFEINKFKDADTYINMSKSQYTNHYPTQMDGMYFDLVCDYFLIESLAKELFDDYSSDKDIENLLHTLNSRGIGSWK